jgi:hypothetical protein
MPTTWTKEIATDSGTTTSIVSSTSSWSKELLDVTASVGRIEVDDLILDGSTIGVSSTPDLLELSGGIARVNGNLFVSSTFLSLGNLQCASTVQSTNGQFTGDVSIAGTLTVGGGTSPDWTVTNLSETRSMDCDGTLSNNQLADLIGTIVKDLQDVGLMR